MTHTRSYKSFLESATYQAPKLEPINPEVVNLGSSYRYILKLVQRGKVRFIDLLCDAETPQQLAQLRKQHFKGWLLDDLESCDVLF